MLRKTTVELRLGYYLFYYILGMDVTSEGRMSISLVREFARNISIAALESPELRNVLINEKFDAVVSEWFFSDVESG